MNIALYCPLCGTLLRKEEWSHTCPKDGFQLPYIYRGYRIPITEKQALLTTGKTSLITEWHRKDGRGTFSGQLTLDREGLLHFIPDTLKGVTCPLCGERVYNSKKLVFCGTCDFTLWYMFAGYTFTEKELHDFLLYRYTSMIHTFVSKDKGKYFSARLRLSAEGEVVFEFE